MATGAGFSGTIIRSRRTNHCLRPVWSQCLVPERTLAFGRHSYCLLPTAYCRFHFRRLANPLHASRWARRTILWQRLFDEE